MKRISTATRVLNKFGAGKDGFTDGDVIGGVPSTDLEAALFDNLQEEVANVVEGTGIVLNGGVLTQLRQAIKRLTGGYVTTINFAASPFALTADNAGVVSVDASAGNVVVNLPAANVLAALKYEFRRTDTSANTVTINRAGADTIDEGGVAFTLAAKGVQKISSDGVSAWSSTTPVAATTAEAQAGANPAKFVTPAALAGSTFGFGQSWQVLTGSRALGTTYTNSSGKLIWVSISYATSAPTTANPNVGGVQNFCGGGINGSTLLTAIFPVPAGATYSLANVNYSSALYWAELR